MTTKDIKNYLEKYIPLVDFIAAILGPNSEVVLNDVTNLDHSVVYIKNPTITNRKVGDPASNFVLKIIKDGIDDNTNYIANYTGKSADTPNLRSSTYIIRYHHQIVGMLCVNINQEPIDNLIFQLNNFKNLIDIKTTTINKAQINNSQTQKTITTENFNNSVTSIAQSAIEKKERELGVSSNYFQQNQKISLIKDLYADGYFLLKDSIKTVADYLNTSVPTVYRYLNKVKNNDADHK